MRKSIFVFSGIVVFGLGVLLIPSLGQAVSSTTSSSTQAFLDQITALMKQMDALNQQINALKVQQQGIGKQLTSVIKDLKKQLNPGDKNDDVAIIQALLAADPSIYPEGLITGHFGELTKKAIKRLQAKHGLSMVGRVGPQTLRVLNELLKQNPVKFESDSDENEHGDNRGLTSSSTASSSLQNNKNEDDEDDDKDSDSRGKEDGNKHRLCAIVPPGHFIAPGWKRKHGGSPILPECQVLPPGIRIPTPTPTPTSTPMVTPSPSQTPTSTPAITPTPTPTATPTPTVTPTPSPTPTPTPTPSPTPTATPTPTVTPTPSPTPTPTPTPSPTPTP